MVESQSNRVIVRGDCDTIKSQPKSEYTWQHVAKKNTEKEAWIVVRDKVYDITGKIS